MPVRAVIFDLFDTLVDLYTERIPFREIEGRQVPASLERTYAVVSDAMGQDAPDLLTYGRLTAEVDRTFREERYAHALEVPSRERFGAIVERLGAAEDLQLRDRLVKAHMDVLQEQVHIPGHHEPILTSLAVEHRLALCSNFSHTEVAKTVLSAGGFDAHLREVVVSEDVRYRKPRAEIFEIVLERLGISADEAIHVGDNLAEDIRGAAAAGLRSVWLTRRVKDPEAKLAKYSGPAPDFSLDDLADLPVLLARLA